MKRIIILIISFLCLNLLLIQGKTQKLYNTNELSSNLINSIVQDKNGCIWIGTDNGLNKFDGYHFRAYLNIPDDTTSLRENVIASLLVDRSGNLFVGTGKGLEIYNRNNDNFESTHVIFGRTPRISDIIQLHNGDILVGTAGFGLYRVNIKGKCLEELSSYKNSQTGNFFSRIVEDRYHNLWNTGNSDIIERYRIIGGKLNKPQTYKSLVGKPVKLITDQHGDIFILCQHGILRYQKNRNKLVMMDLDMSVLNRQNVTFKTAARDKKGNIYLGSIGNGIFCIASGTKVLSRIDNQGKSFDLKTAEIKSICVDRDENIWAGCFKRGLFYLSKKTSPFSYWNFESQNYNIGGAVSSLCKGNNGDLWCVVQNSGIYQFNSLGKIISHPVSPNGAETIYKDYNKDYWIGAEMGLYSFLPKSGISKLIVKIDGENVNYITDDRHGNIYFSSFGKGFCKYNKNKHTIKTFRMKNNDGGIGCLCNDWVLTMTLDSYGLLWIGTSSGVSCFSPNKERFRIFGWHSILKGYLCNSIAEDKNGNILIGTNHGLFHFDRKRNCVSSFSNSLITKEKIISNVGVDNAGDIWCTTSNGILQYRKKNHRFISYVHGDGLEGHEYANSVIVHSQDDRLYFCSGDGITTFLPDMVKKNKFRIGEVQLTNFFIDGKTVNCTSTSNGKQVTSQPIDISRHFNVSYFENSFSMEFSTYNFEQSDNITYEYKINDAHQWMTNEIGKNAIMFNHLSPGQYIIQVRACYNDQYSPVKVYYVTVSPPWYKSLTAYIFYTVVMISFISLIVFIYIRKKRMDLDEEKMQFLINTTHDIRSPLTLIINPLQKLLKENYDTETNKNLKIIEHSSDRISQLVNQILDVRKIDKCLMQLHYQKTELNAYLSGIIKNFEAYAKDNGVELSFEFTQEIELYIDRINFDKVISNLLSNAFKYTKTGDKISISTSVGTDDKAKNPLKYYAEINVIDNGIGIKEENINKIFERFYQSNNAVENKIQGSGIGLNLCKMIVNMHKGSISVANGADTGTIFTVRLPMGKAHIDKNQIMASEEELDELFANKGRKPNKHYYILIVDDDAEIGKYINGELGEYFHFNVCKNGKEALSELLLNDYDLVVSDVIMPEMDGYTLVRMIKSTVKLCHIPVILLTSMADAENRVKGIEKGADAFLVKPFNMEELKAQINNLINNSQRLKGKFSGQMNKSDEIKTEEIKSEDDVLMKKVIKYINENIDDSEYRIEQLASDIGVSRAKLHRKMKELTGISTSEFIRNIRLEKAAKLLREHKANITQITYIVGISSQTRFSTLFKKYFGMTPTEYADQYKE